MGTPIKPTQSYVSTSKSTKNHNLCRNHQINILGAMCSGAVAGRKAWVVAATIGAVEALNDQGICRWNYTIRSLHQHAKANLRSSSLFSSSSSSSPSPVGAGGAVPIQLREETRRKAERNMKKVLELNSWGPSTVRF